MPEKLNDIVLIRVGTDSVDEMNKASRKVSAYGTVKRPPTPSAALVRQSYAVVRPRFLQERRPEATRGFIEVVQPFPVVPSENDLGQVAALVSLNLCCSRDFRNRYQIHCLELYLISAVIGAQSTDSEVYIVPLSQVDDPLTQSHVALSLKHVLPRYQHFLGASKLPRSPVELASIDSVDLTVLINKTIDNVPHSVLWHAQRLCYALY